MITTIILRYHIYKWKQEQQIKEAARRVRAVLERGKL